MWLDEASNWSMLLHAAGRQYQQGEVHVWHAHTPCGWHSAGRWAREWEVQGSDQEAESALQLWQVGPAQWKFSNQVLWWNNHQRKRRIGDVVWRVHEEGMSLDNPEVKEEWREDSSRRDEQSQRIGWSFAVAVDTRHASSGSISVDPSRWAGRRRCSDPTWSEQDFALRKEQCACEAEISGKGWEWRRNQRPDSNHVCRCSFRCEEGS